MELRQVRMAFLIRVGILGLIRISYFVVSVFWLCTMKTYIGIDYRKRFSYVTIMREAREIVKQSRFNNHPDAQSGGHACLVMPQIAQGGTCNRPHLVRGEEMSLRRLRGAAL